MLRSLPLLRPSRPHSTDQSQLNGSRTASPAPPSTTTANVNALSTLNPAYADDRTTRLTERSISAGGQPRGRSLTKPLSGLSGLSLGANGHTTGATTPSPAPAPTSNAAVQPGKVSPPGGSGTATPVHGERATIDAISLRLNEMVNKSLLGVDMKQMKGVKKNNGWATGEAVVKELPPPQSDAYLLRAVIRTAVRSLTIYTSRLEYFLLPAVTQPDFLQPVNLTPTPASAPMLNPIQTFALSICHAAWETCEVLEVALETTAYPRFVTEALRPVMNGLDSVVARVVMPMMASIKKQLLLSLVEDRPSPTASQKALPGGAATLPAKAINHIPTSLRAFASKVDPARRAFELICKQCKEDGETWVASVVVAVVWKGLCICTSGYNADEKLVADQVGRGRTPSPEAVSRALASLTKDPLVSAKPAPAGGVAAMGKMASSILPSRATSRPPSPPKGKAAELPKTTHGNGVVHDRVPPSAFAFASLEALVTRLVTGLVQKPATVAPAADDPTVDEHLAREALAEALEAITSMKLVISAMERGSTFICKVNTHLKDDLEMADPKDEAIVDAAEDVPSVLLFHVLAKRVNRALASSSSLAHHDAARGRSAFEKFRLHSPAQVWGLSDEDYERQVLGAFSVAEERAQRVAGAYKSELERLTRDLMTVQAQAGNKGGVAEELMDARGWIKALALAIEAREELVVRLTGC